MISKRELNMEFIAALRAMDFKKVENLIELGLDLDDFRWEDEKEMSIVYLWLKVEIDDGFSKWKAIATNESGVWAGYFNGIGIKELTNERRIVWGDFA